MSTKSRHTKPAGTSRRFRVLALVASLSIAMAGRAGLGLAAPASADSTPTCPQVDGIDGTLVGDTCVYEHEEAPATHTWTCPGTSVTDGTWVSGAQSPTKPGMCVDVTTGTPETTYSCQTGYSPDGWAPPSTNDYPGNNKCKSNEGTLETTAPIKYEHDDKDRAKCVSPWSPDGFSNGTRWSYLTEQQKQSGCTMTTYTYTNPVGETTCVPRQQGGSRRRVRESDLRDPDAG